MTESAPYTPLSIPDYVALRESERPPLLLDVREPEEYREAHIEGALLIPMNDVLDRIDELRDAESIVVQCRSGARSAMVAVALSEEGLKARLYNLEGGIVAWARAGHPYVEGDE